MPAPPFLLGLTTGMSLAVIAKAASELSSGDEGQTRGASSAKRSTSEDEHRASRPASFVERRVVRLDRRGGRYVRGWDVLADPRPD